MTRSPIELSWTAKKTQKKSENGEIYTAGKYFTLPLATTGGTNLTSESNASGLFLIFHLYDFVYDYFPIVQTFLNFGCWEDDGHPLSVQLHVLFQEETEDHLQGTTWVRLC